MEKSRVELYELVWAKPMTHLAKELGVASRMIALTQNGIRFSWPERSCGS